MSEYLRTLRNALAGRRLVTDDLAAALQRELHRRREDIARLEEQNRKLNRTLVGLALMKERIKRALDGAE